MRATPLTETTLLHRSARKADGGSGKTTAARQRDIKLQEAAITLCSGDDVSMRDHHCKVRLSGRTSHTRVESICFFVPNWICRVGMVI